MTASAVCVACGEAHAERVGDAAPAERALERLADRGVLDGHEMVERLDDRDFGAERPPHARELDADDAAAEDDDATRHLGELQRLFAREDATADLETGKRAAVRAGREDDVGPDVAVVADPHGPVGLEAAFAGDDRDAAGLHEALETLELLRDDALAVRAHRRGSIPSKRRAHADRARPRGRCRRLRPRAAAPSSGCSRGAGTCRRPCPSR